MRNCDLHDVIDSVVGNYDRTDAIFFNKPNRHIPNRNAIIGILKDLRNVMFPGYFTDGAQTTSDAQYFVGHTILRVEQSLKEQVRKALLFRDSETATAEEIEERAQEICSRFLCKLPLIQDLVYKDLEATFEGDPAAQSKEEIVYSYPGLFAIWVYRIAHELYVQDVPLIPRIMTEYAHSRTGVDINAGAQIGEYFFIDHATGVVIGDHVKIYQGVTLGALSTRGGQRLAGVRRHPTIEDNVTIYSNASVLGGETVIGEGSIISGSAFVVESVPAGSRVTVANQKVNVR